MITNIYSVKDDITGFMPPLSIVNEQAAMRWFNNNYRNGHPNANDYHLYEVGYWNSDNGEITSIEPRLLAESEE